MPKTITEHIIKIVDVQAPRGPANPRNVWLYFSNSWFLEKSHSFREGRLAPKSANNVSQTNAKIIEHWCQTHHQKRTPKNWKSNLKCSPKWFLKWSKTRSTKEPEIMSLFNLRRRPPGPARGPCRLACNPACRPWRVPSCLKLCQKINQKKSLKSCRPISVSRPRRGRNSAPFSLMLLNFRVLFSIWERFGTNLVLQSIWYFRPCALWVVSDMCPVFGVRRYSRSVFNIDIYIYIYLYIYIERYIYICYIYIEWS